MLPIQCSLELNWDLHTDCFLFSVCDEVKPYTRRGVSSTLNSLYDPLGFVAPVTIQGKGILREPTSVNGDWDAPLPKEMEEAWTSWRVSLSDLPSLSIPRAYTQTSPSAAVRRELCVFSNASTKAIAAVTYLKITDSAGNCHGTAREPVEKVEIWVQMQVSSSFFINSKANRQKQNNNQKRDTPDGNVVLVSRAHKPNVIGTNNNTVNYKHIPK